MKTTSLILIAFSSLFISCATISSSIHYTKGTECLEKGDALGAVAELKKAVELNPNFARNHTNLAAAYIQLNELDKAWYHSRQAVLCPYPDAMGGYNFAHLCDVLIKNNGLDQPGTSLEEIIAKLGEPDGIVDSDDHSMTRCFYGTYLMNFSHGKLTSSEFK